jgi:hypothetical protein
MTTDAICAAVFVLAYCITIIVERALWVERCADAGCRACRAALLAAGCER